MEIDIEEIELLNSLSQSEIFTYATEDAEETISTISGKEVKMKKREKIIFLKLALVSLNKKGFIDSPDIIEKRKKLKKIDELTEAFYNLMLSDATCSFALVEHTVKSITSEEYYTEKGIPTNYSSQDFHNKWLESPNNKIEIFSCQKQPTL